MKIAAISDMHGMLNFKVENVDILFICGDILLSYPKELDEMAENWFVNQFLHWCNCEVDANDIYFVGGNHDWWIYKYPERVKQLCKENSKDPFNHRVHYLYDEDATYCDEQGNIYTIYGTPWCHKFMNWAFMDYDHKALYEMYKDMPENVDFLITHDAPYGVSDVCTAPWNTGQHLGNWELKRIIEERKPKYNFHGHLHTSNHECEMLGDTKVYNTSLTDEYYKLEYKPFYLEIQPNQNVAA